MPERIELKAVPDSHFVFRLIAPDSTYFPAGATLPLAGWLSITKSDKQAADARGRAPGLSCFDRELCPVKTAKELLSRYDDLAFGATVTALKAVATTHERQLEVVYQPRTEKAPQPGLDAHVLIEGLSRPEGGVRKAQNDFLEAIVQALGALGPA